MNRFSNISWAGFVISLTGSLPPGVLNIKAFSIAATQGPAPALLFSTGAALAEVVYLQLTLYSAAWLHKQHRWLHILQWLAVLLFGAIAFNSLLQAFYPATTARSAIITYHSGNVLLYGILLSAINPAQFPFWIGWNTLLLSKGVLKPNLRHHLLYIAGVGAGTLAALCMFVVAGCLWQYRGLPNTSWMHAITGVIYLLCAVVLLRKLVRERAYTNIL